MTALQRATAFLAAALCIACFNACSRQVYDTDRILDDFQTAGFLDANHFQAVIRGTADQDARGLVEIRDSSLKNAREKMESAVISMLSEYCFNHHMKYLGIKDRNEILNLPEAESGLAGMLIPFYKKGRIAFEYFDRDGSAILVYRIYGRNLQSRLEDINPKIKLKKTNGSIKQGKVVQ